MKKVLLLTSLMLIASVSFAVEERASVVDPAMAPRMFNTGDINFHQAHVCSANSSNCQVPEKLITGTTRLNILFWAPSTQGYGRYFIVSGVDGGTVVFIFYGDPIVFNAGSYISRTVDAGLPPGDYIFTAIVIPDTSGSLAVSDQYKFSVR